MLILLNLKVGKSGFAMISGIENQSISVQTRFAGNQTLPLSQISILEFNKRTTVLRMESSLGLFTVLRVNLFLEN